MTREEREDAINCFKNKLENEVFGAKYNKLALEALEQEPCDDCISRDSAIKALDYDIKCFEFKPGVSKHMDDIAKLLNTIYETQVNNIKTLPSVPQEPILDKIRAEMFEEMLSHNGTGEEVIQAYADGLKKGLDILDKYKAEFEVEDGN